MAATGRLGSTCSTDAAGVENVLCVLIRIHAPSTCPRESNGIYRTPLRYRGHSHSATHGGVQQMRLGIGQIPDTPHSGHPVYQWGLASQAATQNACSGQYGARRDVLTKGPWQGKLVYPAKKGPLAG